MQILYSNKYKDVLCIIISNGKNLETKCWETG